MGRLLPLLWHMHLSECLIRRTGQRAYLPVRLARAPDDLQPNNMTEVLECVLPSLPNCPHFVEGSATTST